MTLHRSHKAGISDLSTELLLHIASFLSQVDLLNISLTDKHLRGCTEPELYREYKNTSGHGRPFKPFLQRIIERPDLKRHVRRLELRWWTTLNNMNPARKQEYPELTLDEYWSLVDAAISTGLISKAQRCGRTSDLIKRVQRLWEDSNWNDNGMWYEYVYSPVKHIDEVSFDIKFCQHLRAGLEDPQVMLMIALLPNVREIVLLDAPYERNNLLCNAPLHQFHALRKFTVSATYGDMEFPLSYFNDLIQSANNLETLEVYWAGDWESNWERIWRFRPLSLSSQSLNLTRILLQFCAFTYSGIKTLLSACRTLTSFNYTAGGNEVGPDNFTCPELVELLMPHKSTLKALKVDMSTSWNYDKNAGLLPSLTEFTQLERLYVISELSVPGAFNYSDIPKPDRLCNRLPASLQVLSLADDETGHVLHHLHEVVTLRSEKFPRLKTINILVPHKKRWVISNMAKVPFAGADIDLTINDMMKVMDSALMFESWVDKDYEENVKWVGGMYITEASDPHWMRLRNRNLDDSDLSITEESDVEV
jgi:hypothetical protein